MTPKTINAIFIENARQFPDDVIVRYKQEKGGDFVDLTWAGLAEAALSFAAGLSRLGLVAGDRLAILAFNRIEWIVADLGTLLAGGVDVPIYHTNTAEQCRYVLGDAGVRFVVVEDEVQLEKVLAFAHALPDLERIIVMEGAVPENDPRVMTFGAVVDLGKGAEAALFQTIEEKALGASPESLATIVYTSGTTGPPKGCMVSHGNAGFVLDSIDRMHKIESRGNLSLLVLPLSHFYPRVSGYYFNLFKNIPLAIGESIDTLGADIQAVRPTYFCCVPRILEKVYARIAGTARSGGWLSRAIFNFAMKAGKARVACLRIGWQVPLLLQLELGIADALVFTKIRKRLGGRLSFAVSAGAPLSAEVGEFIHSIGIRVIEFYGLSETLGGTMTTLDACRYGTVGKAMPGFEVSLAEDGEILLRGNNFMGYWNHPEKTAEAIVDGWCRTGDIGAWENGYLKITDRKKDLIITSGGKNISPQNLENLVINRIPLVSNAMVYGDSKKYLTVLLTLDPAEVEAFAKKKELAWDSYEALTQSPEIRAAVLKDMDQINAGLAQYETMKKFFILPREFSLEEDEVTPTLKLKRKAVQKKYRDRMEALYESDF
ncbi:MAG: long-chain fatty acid--CoA ligase [Desulfobacterales bacterium]|nr:long-chain fatty acid--CoA ligase [Desulfobacterales bacterium]